MHRLIKYPLLSAIIVDAACVALWLFASMQWNFSSELEWAGFLIIGLALGILGARMRIRNKNRFYRNQL
jgi:phosphatidylglycerophosphate synthase